MTIDADLNKRLKRVVRKHERMKENGVVHSVGRDGLIRSRPRLFKFQFPIKSVMLVVALLVVFKAMIYAQSGAGEYVAQVEELRDGSTVEQVGAFIMQDEPVTVRLGGFLSQYFFKG